MGHPVGGEALELTERYLASRFGGAPFTPENRREFVRRVRALRVQRPSTDRAA